MFIEFSMIKRFFNKKLRKSHSVNEDHQRNTVNQAGTSNGGSHLSSSKTYDGSK